MKIYGFIGASGTGKSHNASWVASERKIEYIIDDGLLIKGTNIVAGTSAKRESTRIGSIKKAIFVDPEQADEIRQAIERVKPESILILGTSDEMVNLIVEHLSLPPVSERIYINDVATEESIRTAMIARKEKGKHVIPVPAMEIKRQFSGYFLDPLNIFHKKDRHRYKYTGEKSIVRPTFSYMGKFEISDTAIRQMVDHVAAEFPGINKILKCTIDNNREGRQMDVDVAINYGYPIKPMLIELQNEIIRQVESSTGINIIKLNITAKTVTVE